MSEGAGSVLAYGFEDAPLMPGGTTRYMQFISEGLNTERPLEENPNISASHATTEPENLLVESAGNLVYAPDVVSILPRRIHHLGWYDTTLDTAGVWTYEIRREAIGDVPMTTNVDTLFHRIYRDDGVYRMLLGGKIGQITVGGDANDFLRVTESIINSRDTFMADPLAVTGNNAAGDDIKVVAFGHRSDPDSTADIVVEVMTTGPMDGTARVSFGKVGGPALAGAGYAVYDGRKIPVIYEDGTHASGDPRDPVYVMFVDDGGANVLTDGDQWTIEAKRTVSAPTYSTAATLTTVSGAIVINGNPDYSIESLTATLTRPLTENPSWGSKYRSIPVRDGKDSAVITFDRKYIDRDFEKLNISRAKIGAYFELYGNRIGSTGFYEKWRVEIPNMRVSGGGTNVGGPGALDETVSLMGYVPRGSTDPLWAEYITCAVDPATMT
jgi:hypothetical protein